MTRRYLLTLFSTILVLGVYSVYAQVSKQFLKRSRHVSQQQLRTTSKIQVSGPVLNQGAALKHLPDVSWTMNARVKIHADGLHLFFNDRVQENGNKEIRISPVAMIWDAAPEKQSEHAGDPSKKHMGPITILAESATFVFDQPVELSEIKMHMLQEGMLRGKVVIRGENGLKITGRDFVFSRAAQHLSSYKPVYMQMQQSEVQANNIQLDLVMLDGPLYRDNPRILGISEIHTSGHLEMSLVPRQGDPPAIVNCERSFHYQVEEKLATLEEDVSIIRIDEKGYTDSIDCDRLELQFADAASGKSGSMKQAGQPGNNLKIHSIRAIGSPVVCKSQENHLQARGRQLDYDFQQNIIILKGYRRGSKNRALLVDIKYLDSDLESPRLEIHLNEKREPIYAYCDGPGNLTYHEEKLPPAGQISHAETAALVTAFWNDSLSFAPEKPESANFKVITLTGNSMIQSPQHRSGMISDTLRLLLEIKDLPVSASDTSSRSKSWKMHKATAKGNIAISSPYVEGEYETLTLNFEERSDQQLAAFVNRQSSHQKKNNNSGIQQTSAQKTEVDNLNLHIDARDVTLDILHNYKFTEYHVAHIETSGNVIATGKIPDAEESFQVQGQGVDIKNAADNNRQFRLFGTAQRYAFIQNGSLRIEGTDLLVDTAVNFSRVLGAGSLQFPVDADMEGNKLDQMQMMEVFWSEQMRFKGQQIHFVGKVRAVIQDSVINCEQLWVTLDQPVSFQNPDQQIKPQIKEIVCSDGVKLEMNQFENGKLVAVRLIDVATFTINHITGDMQAQGPGEMNFWQRRTGKAPLGLPEATFKKKEKQVLQKNEQPTTGWDYTKVTFAGQMKGNIDQKQKLGHAAFHDRVNVLHGPVSGPLIQFTRDDRPPESAWMVCGLLEIQAFSIDPANNPKAKSSLAIEFKASKNAEIEGDQFRARSNIITFDQARNLFIMRGEENRHVTLWRYENRQSPRHQLDVMMVTISPDGKVVKLDRILGASGSQ